MRNRIYSSPMSYSIIVIETENEKNHRHCQEYKTRGEKVQCHYTLRFYLLLPEIDFKGQGKFPFLSLYVDFRSRFSFHFPSSYFFLFSFFGIHCKHLEERTFN